MTDTKTIEFLRKALTEELSKAYAINPKECGRRIDAMIAAEEDRQKFRMRDLQDGQIGIIGEGQEYGNRMVYRKGTQFFFPTGCEEGAGCTIGGTTTENLVVFPVGFMAPEVFLVQDLKPGQEALIREKPSESGGVDATLCTIRVRRNLNGRLEYCSNYEMGYWDSLNANYSQMAAKPV